MSKVLLAYNVEGCPILREGMWKVSTLQRSHKATVRTTHLDERPMLFAQWGLDIIGPFPMAMRQLKFLVVGINYFTKWVEAEPLPTITEKNVRSFVWKSIICRFGIPRVLVFDGSIMMRSETFAINWESETTTLHPSTNKLMGKLRLPTDHCSNWSRFGWRG